MAGRAGLTVVIVLYIHSTMFGVYSSSGIRIDSEKGLAPEFVTQSRSLTAEEGGRVALPCQIRNQGSYVVVWKRGRRVLSARDTVVTRDHRFQLGVHNSLQISPVQPGDQGTYTCVLDTETLMEVTHTLQVLYGPRVKMRSEDGLLIVERNKPAHLECNANGNPTPTIRWRKQIGRLADGTSEHQGSRYVIERVTRRMAGVYECVADNGHGSPGVGTVTLQVQYPPEVQVEQSSVFSGVGRTAGLLCRVRSDPPSHVVWVRDGVTLDRTRYVSMDDIHGIRHTLLVKPVRTTDFGTYTCLASNQLGKASGNMLLSGTPGKVRVISRAVSVMPDAYQLAWQVTSFQHVLEYKVAYRHNKHNSTRGGIGSSWREVLVPVTGSEVFNSSLFRQRIPLRGLKPASVYDVHVQSRNRHGWGPISDLFHFSTLARGEALKSRNSGVGAEWPQLCPMVFATLSVLATYYHIRT